jgi:hypothetical protein
VTTEAVPWRLQPAPRVEFGSFVDCNMASAWVGDTFRIFPGKYGEDPVWGFADDLRIGEGRRPSEAFGRTPDELRRPRLPANAPADHEHDPPCLHGAVWFESVYSSPADPSGRTLYALYHNENYPSTLPYDERAGTGYRTTAWPPGLQGDSSIQAVPRIGLMRSTDGGDSWTDRGIVLEDRDERLVRSPVNRNNTFPGGVGDPSAVASGDHLYVFFGAYGYPGAWTLEDHDPEVERRAQCISVARIALDRLDESPVRARRWGGRDFSVEHDGIGRPIEALQIDPADGGGPVSAGDRSFYWGPSVSWNTDLECWVMVMGRVDAPYWAGDSVFISFNRHRDLGVGDNAQDWTAPELLLRSPGHSLWYPCLQPTDDEVDVQQRRTSTSVGRRSRLFVKTLSGLHGHYASDFLLELG